MNDPRQPNSYAPAAPTNTLAVVSLASAVVSWVFLPIIGAIVAIITGHMARREIRESFGAQGGDGLALAGLIIGYANLGLNCLALLVFVVLFGGALGLSICTALPEATGMMFSGDFITSFLSH